MKVAVYGGSFNPPHVGHAMVASWLLWTERVDAVWLVPTYVHAFSKALLPWEERLELCEALAELLGPRVSVCTKERDLAPPSYTLNLLAELERQHPEHEFRLVLGTDCLEDLPKWHRWEEIERRFEPLWVARQGYPGPAESPPFPGVSSTEVRRRLEAGEPVDHLVPERVLERIRTLGDRHR